MSQRSDLAAIPPLRLVERPRWAWNPRLRFHSSVTEEDRIHLAGQRDRILQAVSGTVEKFMREQTVWGKPDVNKREITRDGLIGAYYIRDEYAEKDEQERFDIGLEVRLLGERHRPEGGLADQHVLVVRLILKPEDGRLYQLVDYRSTSTLSELEIRRVELPTWAREPSVKFRGEFSDEQKAFVKEKRVELLEALQKVLENELPSSSGSGEPHDFYFPDRSWMTGEYYLSDERYEMEGERSFRCMIDCHFLAKPYLENQTEFDYLGQDVFMDFNADRMMFEVEEANVHTSVI